MQQSVKSFGGHSLHTSRSWLVNIDFFDILTNNDFKIRKRPAILEGLYNLVIYKYLMLN
ncbi:hypothetical protein KIN20_021000 [Parelaphostrongylus tenuis]|uniref:Uncharacterized protein n=1 Tax=Parelaphostrongylus tenuis TaxID=148309 RepID=A0AAD5QR95_PARTN|nr:hypothetical protein KIN20_021000 [Parelaphostrongylus tenuis]